MRDNFAGFSEKQLKSMMQRSAWFNNDLVSDADLEEMEMQLLEKTNKPIRFAGGGDDRKQELGAIEVEPRLLCEEVLAVDARRDARPVPRGWARDSIVLHRMARHGTDHRRLCEWNKMSDVVEPFIQPIHYNIYSSSRQNLRSTEVNSAADPSTRLQNRLIHSHLDEARSELRVREFVQAFEPQLDVILSRLFLHRHVAVFIFEWCDPMPFCFLLAFRLQLEERSHASKDEETLGDFLQTRVITLQREDVLRLYYDEFDAELQQPQQEQKKRRKRQQQQQEEERHDVEDLAQDEAQLRDLKRRLGEGRLSYVTAGYAKRD